MGEAVADREFVEAMRRDGFALAPSIVAEAQVEALLDALAAPPQSELRRRGGQRDVLDRVPAAADVARSSRVRRLAEAVLGPGCFVVRGLLFDKTPGANWKVPWHQDLTVAVRERHDAPGFGPWTVKAGVAHTHAPPSILEQMVSLRVHLDDCTSENGPLRVLPGSHRGGQLSAADAARWQQRVPAVTCLAKRGDVLAFHPLLLHASSPATHPAHRRVLHLEFSAAVLPATLQWRWQV